MARCGARFSLLRLLLLADARGRAYDVFGLRASWTSLRFFGLCLLFVLMFCCVLVKISTCMWIASCMGFLVCIDVRLLFTVDLVDSDGPGHALCRFLDSFWGMVDAAASEIRSPSFDLNPLACCICTDV